MKTRRVVDSNRLDPDVCRLFCDACIDLMYVTHEACNPTYQDARARAQTTIQGQRQAQIGIGRMSPWQHKLSRRHQTDNSIPGNLRINASRIPGSRSRSPGTQGMRGVEEMKYSNNTPTRGARLTNVVKSMPGCRDAARERERTHFGISRGRAHNEHRCGAHTCCTCVRRTPDV